jgi:prepilin-type N-terminal cleavage/methylation domain-containing protein
VIHSKAQPKPQHRSAGFSLIELMVATVILAIVLAGVFESFVLQMKSSMVAEEVVEAQQNVRAIASLIEREIRTAGFMVPDGAGICGLDATTGSDQLWISETEIYVTDAVKEGDLGARVTSTLSASSTQTLTLDQTTVDLDGDGAFFYDNDSNGTADSDFRTGGGFTLTDLENPDRGVICGIVDDADPTSFTVTIVSGTFSTLTVAGEELVVVPAAHYRITGTGRLERNQDLLANSVEDFQVAFFFDLDDDGDVDSVATEYPGASGGPVYDPNAWDNNDLKEVRFSISVRARKSDPDFAIGSFAVFENRVDPGFGSDGFRRRVSTSTVRPRNIGVIGGI